MRLETATLRGVRCSGGTMAVRINKQTKKESQDLEGKVRGRWREGERKQNREQQKFLLEAQGMLTRFSVVYLRGVLVVSWRPHSYLILGS